MGVWTRIRQNLSLKIVSLVAAILLYAYVQQERNPTISKTLLVNVDYQKAQVGYQVVSATHRVAVTVTGPRPIVEHLKDGELKATADIGNLTSSQASVPVRIVYELPKGVADVTIEPAQEFAQVQVYREKSRKVRVEPIWKNDPPAGMRYGKPVVHPSFVTIHGREDYVNRVDLVGAPASPSEPHASIDGDFSLQAWDGDHNVVEGIEFLPNTVHITIPQMPLPSESIVQVNVIYADGPAFPYTIVDSIRTPNMVKIIGSSSRVASIRGINTETLSVHDLTSTTTINANLIIPPDVVVTDLQGKPIDHVKVTFTVSKTKTEAPPAPSGGAGTTPKRDGGAVQ